MRSRVMASSAPNGSSMSSSDGRVMMARANAARYVRRSTLVGGNLSRQD